MYLHISNTTSNNTKPANEKACIPERRRGRKRMGKKGREGEKKGIERDCCKFYFTGRELN